MTVPDFGVCFAWCNGRDDIGQGTFGAVRRARHLPSGKTVAAKSFDGNDAKVAALSEAAFFMSLNNPHVVHCLGLAAEGPNTLLLVMELCVLGTLEAHNASCCHAMPFDIVAHLELPRHPTSPTHNVLELMCRVL